MADGNNNLIAKHWLVAPLLWFLEWILREHLDAEFDDTDEDYVND